MRGRLFGRRWRLCAFGTVLCLLAALFAFEAKLAGYSNPSSTPSSQISAAKLWPADASKLIAQALSAPSILRHLPAEPIVLALFVAMVPLSFGEPVCEGHKLQISYRHSPHLFQRPPPQS